MYEYAYAAVVGRGNGQLQQLPRPRSIYCSPPFQRPHIHTRVNVFKRYMYVGRSPRPPPPEVPSRSSPSSTSQAAPCSACRTRVRRKPIRAEPFLGKHRPCPAVLAYELAHCQQIPTQYCNCIHRQLQSSIPLWHFRSRAAHAHATTSGFHRHSAAATAAAEVICLVTACRNVSLSAASADAAQRRLSSRR